MIDDYEEFKYELTKFYDIQVENLKQVKIRCDLILIKAEIELKLNGIKKGSEFYEKLMDVTDELCKLLNQVGEYISKGVNTILYDKRFKHTNLESSFMKLNRDHDIILLDFQENINEILDKCK